MASLPEGAWQGREPAAETQEAWDSGHWYLAQAFAWLAVMAPAAALSLCLGNWLEAISEGARAIALGAFIGAAIFAAFAVGSEFAAAARPEAEVVASEGAEKRSRHYPVVAAAAAALPLVFSLLGGLLAWGPVAEIYSGLLLLITAAFVAVLNGFSWFFAHYLVKELARRPGESRAHGLYAAFQVAQAGRAARKYAAPIHPALIGLAMIALFVFAFAIHSAPEAGPYLWSRQSMVVIVVAFAIALLGLLALSRFHSLHLLARSEHLAFAGIHQKRDSAGLDWAAPAGLGILIVCFLSALLPLKALVRLGEFMRIQPPQRGLQPQPSPAGTGEGVFDIRLLLLGAGGWLLLLLVLALASFFGWLLWRRLRRARTWERLMKQARLFLSRLRQWVKRLLRGRPGALEMAAESKAGEPGGERFHDVFEDGEAMGRLSAAQIIMATFHLLLEYTAERGWLRRVHCPPFEILHILVQRSALDQTDLAYLTWAYSQAAYSLVPPAQSEVVRVREVWSRLKAQLLAPEEARAPSA